MEAPDARRRSKRFAAAAVPARARRHRAPHAWAARSGRRAASSADCRPAREPKRTLAAVTLRHRLLVALLALALVPTAGRHAGSRSISCSARDRPLVPARASSARSTSALEVTKRRDRAAREHARWLKASAWARAAGRRRPIADAERRASARPCNPPGSTSSSCIERDGGRWRLRSNSCCPRACWSTERPGSQRRDRRFGRHPVTSVRSPQRRARRGRAPRLRGAALVTGILGLARLLRAARAGAARARATTASSACTSISSAASC